MPRHRSLRLDGPEYRGRPLGHRLDPLRSVLDPFAPGDFEALVERLLKAHDFRPTREIEIASLLDRPIGMASATVGRLYLTYEWTTPLETEFGVGPDSDFGSTLDRTPPRATRSSWCTPTSAQLRATPKRPGRWSISFRPRESSARSSSSTPPTMGTDCWVAGE
jgi:hypothetical protein